jgi:tRNA pseudouridine38-40 synthase
MNAGAELTEGMRRVRLDIAYDGTDFHGAQVQPCGRTVGGEIEAALARITGAARRVSFAGRTDQGVHAAGQVAHVDLPATLPDERLLRALNAVLSDDVAIIAARTVPATFHARYDARWREYRYQVWNAPTRHPALTRTTWHLRRPLNLAALDVATMVLLGEHDFAAFAGQGLGVPARSGGRSTVRAILDATWTAEPAPVPVPEGRLIEFRVRGTGFLPQMVRTIVGAAIEVGMGRQRPEWFAAIQAGRDRRAVPAPAPPQGLSLWAVGYETGA